MEPSAPKAVFLSYASQDADAARRIAQALRAEGIEVWFDESALAGGEAWDASIRRQIRDCALFVAIVSANTQARKEGYFRLEWKLADERSHLIAEGTPFVLPVIIDGTKERDALVPKSFLGVQWTWLPHGEVPPTFVRRVQHLLGIGDLPASATTPPQADSASGQQFATLPPAAPEMREEREPRLRLRWTLVLPWTLCVALAIGGAWLGLRPAQTPSPNATASPSLSITLPASMELVFESVARSVDITPDGKTVLFVAKENGISRAYLRALDSFDIKPVPKSEGAIGLLAGPDGKSLAAFIRIDPNHVDTRRLSLDGSSSVPLVSDLSWDASWESGNRLLVNGGDGKNIIVISTDGRGQTKLPGVAEGAVLAPVDLSDKWIAAHASVSTSAGFVLAAVPRNSGGALALTREGPKEFSAATTEQLIYGRSPKPVAPGFLGYTSSDGIVMLAKIDPEKAALIGEPRPVLTNVRVEPYVATAQFAVSDDGTLTYIEGPAAVRGSFVWYRDGTLVPIGLQEGNYAGFRLSRDGRRLISVVHGSAGPLTLRVFDVSGQSSPQVVPDQAPQFSSAWWPDSTSIVHGSRTGWIVRRTVRDMAVVERVKDDGHSQVVDVSPDGKIVALSRWQAATEPGVWFMSWPDGKRALVDGDRAAGFGSFSRDGKWFAYARPEPTMTRYEVRVSPVSNPAQSRAVAIGYSPTWSPDDKELLYAGDASIWSMRRTGEEFDTPRRVYEGQFLVGGQIIEVHPDGRLLLAVPKPQPPVREIRVIPNWLAKVTAGWK